MFTELWRRVVVHTAVRINVIMQRIRAGERDVSTDRICRVEEL